jgi:hypothetical protein
MKKKPLVPDYIYAARLDERDIPFFEQQFYANVDFYSENIKTSMDRFKYGLRIGHCFMSKLEKEFKAYPIKHSIASLGDAAFEWHFLPALFSKQVGQYAICAGAGSNISFETSLACEFPDIKVLVLDPSPQAINHVNALTLPSNLNFIPVGLSNKDHFETFFKPSTPGIGSLSVLHLHPGDECFSLPVKRLITILKDVGIEKNCVSYLKFDIEGMEHFVIDDLIDSRLRPAQLAFEFDQPVPPWTIERTLKRLLCYNYTIVDIWGYNILAIDNQYLEC